MKFYLFLQKFNKIGLFDIFLSKINVQTFRLYFNAFEEIMHLKS